MQLYCEDSEAGTNKRTSGHARSARQAIATRASRAPDQAARSWCPFHWLTLLVTGCEGVYGTSGRKNLGTRCQGAPAAAAFRLKRREDTAGIHWPPTSPQSARDKNIGPGHGPR